MTVELRHAAADADIAAAFEVMRDLRPHLASAEELVARVRAQASETYRLLLAWDAGAVVGAAGYRRQTNLIRGPFVYVDDLVVRADRRRGGLGARLLDAVSAEARAMGVGAVVLDTGLDNAYGQRFYFRYGMLLAAFRFAKPLG